MGLAMISIMLYHQNWITDSVFFEWVRMLGYIGVEVFLFISGFGIAHSLRKNSLVQYYKNRAIRLFPACILFGICKIVLSYIPSMPPIQNLVLDFFSLSHWYIYAIVVYYLIAPVLYKMIGKWGGYFFDSCISYFSDNLLLAIRCGCTIFDKIRSLDCETASGFCFRNVCCFKVTEVAPF